MGIKDMLRREDFYRILKDTIVEYALVVLGKQVCCEYTPFNGGEPWFVNRILGFVSRKPVPNGVRTYMKSEYNVRGCVMKNLLGKIAVEIISRFPHIGTSRIVYVTSGVFEPSVFIVPQNRSIRFYDYEKMKVDCIIKSGFTSKYFDNQMSFRKEYQYEFMNPMLLQGDRWFQEHVLQGHPLVRTTDGLLFKKGTEDAFQYLKSLATDTLEWRPINEYIQTIKGEALEKITRAKLHKCILEVDAAIVLVEKAAKLAMQSLDDIPICVSHGDFQSGNIWIVPTGKTIIYDWETAGKRSVWYDSATLYYSLRRAYGWSTMLEDSSYIGLNKCLPDNVKIHRKKSSIMGILLLEDIIFYLDDMLELPYDWGRDEFDRFIRNINDLNFEI